MRYGIDFQWHCHCINCMLIYDIILYTIIILYSISISLYIQQYTFFIQCIFMAKEPKGHESVDVCKRHGGFKINGSVGLGKKLFCPENRYARRAGHHPSTPSASWIEYRQRNSLATRECHKVTRPSKWVDSKKKKKNRLPNELGSIVRELKLSYFRMKLECPVQRSMYAKLARGREPLLWLSNGTNTSMKIITLVPRLFLVLFERFWLIAQDLHSYGPPLQTNFELVG